MVPFWNRLPSAAVAPREMSFIVLGGTPTPGSAIERFGHRSRFATTTIMIAIPKARDRTVIWMSRDASKRMLAGPHHPSAPLRYSRNRVRLRLTPRRPKRKSFISAILGEASVAQTELRAMADSRRGKRGDAIAALTKAAAQEDSLPFEFGPPAIEKPSHELLAEMLLSAGRPRDARREFEIALKRTPGRSLALLGLARACRAMGDGARRRGAYRQLASNWNADSTMAAAREARAGAK